MIFILVNLIANSRNSLSSFIFYIWTYFPDVSSSESIVVQLLQGGTSMPLPEVLLCLSAVSMEVRSDLYRLGNTCTSWHPEGQEVLASYISVHLTPPACTSDCPVSQGGPRQDLGGDPRGHRQRLIRSMLGHCQAYKLLSTILSYWNEVLAKWTNLTLIFAVSLNSALCSFPSNEWKEGRMKWHNIILNTLPGPYQKKTGFFLC